MENNESTNFAAQLLILQTKHRQLDMDIQEMHTFPFVDQFKLQRLKREKLQLKESIVTIKGYMIPDLDA